MSNSFVKEHFEVFVGTQKLREQLTDILTDADLSFTPGGDAMTLGELCKEMGEVEHAYVQSFKTLKQDFAYRNNEPGLATSIEKLRAWFKALDEELNSTIEGFSNEEMAALVDRGGGFVLPRTVQAHIYREALMLFIGKASIYLKAMKKLMPQQWQEWIG